MSNKSIPIKWNFKMKGKTLKKYPMIIIALKNCKITYQQITKIIIMVIKYLTKNNHYMDIFMKLMKVKKLKFYKIF
jgi:ABC-type cobalamin transport system ATPase subunit